MGAKVWFHQAGGTEAQRGLKGAVRVIHMDVHLRDIRRIAVRALVQHDERGADLQAGMLNGMIVISGFADQGRAESICQEADQPVGVLNREVGRYRCGLRWAGPVGQMTPFALWPQRVRTVWPPQ